MLESLLEWDKEALVLLNMSGKHTAFGDFFIWMSTQTITWVPAFLTFLYVVIKNKTRESLLLIGVIVILFVLCDQISSSVIKPLVARPRPSQDPLVMNLLQYVNDYRGGQFGFLSSHAANAFGFATFSALLFRYKWYSLFVFLWATLHSYTRLYLGVHFPLDIIAGILLGLLIGSICFWIYQKAKLFIPRYDNFSSIKNRQFAKYTKTGFMITSIQLLLYSFSITLFCLLFCAWQMQKF